jgi:MFS transporter, ACS family, glucarate transporter
MSLTPPDSLALQGPVGVARYKALAFFAALAAITYLDRICMAQAADPISRALGLDKRQMGWVFSAFTLSYTLFEVPTGWLGDRIGPRKVLVRVVLWWSVFTALTGWAGSLAALLLIRFAFGMGEAGAFPNIARGLTRWFPHEQRGRAQGVVWTTARLGGAVAPPLTAIVMAYIGWRATFVVYAALGVVWAWWFWHWYRDEPADHPSVSDEERLWMATWQAKVDEVGGKAGATWRSVLTNRSIWGLAGATFCVSFAWFFNATWLPTYLSEERKINLSQASWYASLPFVFGIAGCAFGGWISDALVEALGGVRWARRAVGFAGSTLAGICFLLSLRVTDPLQAVLVMGLAAFFNDMTLGSLWAACMDIGERDSGRVAGVVNTASGLGGFLSPMVFGELLERGYGWSPALNLAGAFFLLGGLCWLAVDPTRTVAAADVDAEFA